MYPARHAAHTVVEPTYCEQPGTEQAGRRLREEERERLPLSLPPQARDVSLTYDAASHPELRDWGHAKRSHAAISTATKRRIGTLLAATLKDKHVGLYFSAHWCPPCQRFTPELAETYKAIKAARGDFELVFVSGDRDAAQSREYFATMPWLALPFDKKRYEALSSHYEVEGIPTLVLLSPEGKVITTKGRAAVSADPEGKDFPNWGPKPVSTLEEVAGDLNESPALIVLCEKASTEEKSAIATALKAPADAVFAAAAAADAEPEMMFAIGEASGNIADQVRRLTKLEESKGVAMVLLDIPDNGAYYVWQRPEGAGEIAVTEADVSKFVADYRAKSLERLQLS